MWMEPIGAEQYDTEANIFRSAAAVPLAAAGAAAAAAAALLAIELLALLLLEARAADVRLLSWGSTGVRCSGGGER